MNNKVNLDLRRKVAELAGWIDITYCKAGRELRGGAKRCPLWNMIPHYEEDVEAITELLSTCNIEFSPCGVFPVSCSDYGEPVTLTVFREKSSNLSGGGETAAIALCNLFILVRKSRKAKNEDDRDHLTETLILRQKVATSAGWTDLFVSEVNNELWGEPPSGAPRARTWHYEKNVDAVVKLLLANDIGYQRDTFADNIDTSPKNTLYTDRKTGITACGQTDAIALCNLFIAVMESRLAANVNLQEPPTQEEFINTASAFTRETCQNIAEKALNSITETTGIRWDRAFEDLAIAADRIDAMLARQELDGANEEK